MSLQGGEKRGKDSKAKTDGIINQKTYDEQSQHKYY